MEESNDGFKKNSERRRSDGKNASQTRIRLSGILKGVSGEELYRKECELKNAKIDRCQLYLYRAVAYFVNTPDANPAKCKWHYFKDDFYEPSPCGVVCAECEYFPADCKGCRAIEGKAFWTRYVE